MKLKLLIAFDDTTTQVAKIEVPNEVLNMLPDSKAKTSVIAEILKTYIEEILITQDNPPGPEGLHI